MKVQSLHLYPVKSLAGLSVEAFSLDEFGPVGDRRWMIVDANKEFVTQRSRPELARVQPRFEGKQLVVAIPGEGDFLLEMGSEPCLVNVWRDVVKGVYGGAEASEALSRFCGADLRFVYMPDDSFRRVDPDRVPEYRRVSFADGFPLLVTNSASLQELNARLEHPVEMRRFRPNIVVSGAEAWQEDHWETLLVGDVVVRLVKPCSRCVLTTVDPDTGIKSANSQPLRTLGSYRRTPDGVIFGTNGVHDANGRISVGDSVRTTAADTITPE